MCLSTITGIHEKPKKTKVLIGYKAVLREGKRLLSYWAKTRAPHSDKAVRVYPLGKWIRETNDYMIKAFDFSEGPIYPCGFSVCPNKAKCEKLLRHNNWFGCEAVKVKYKEVVAEGTQNGVIVHIAKQLLILRKQTD